MTEAKLSYDAWLKEKKETDKDPREAERKERDKKREELQQKIERKKDAEKVRSSTTSY